MAKPFKHAALICTILTIIALLGIVTGLILKKPLIIIAGMIPSVLYEIYRTEGRSTKWASGWMLIALIAEIVFIVKGISFNLADFVGVSEKTVGGFAVPLGDIKVVAPAFIAVLAIILFIRTRGVYTRWLAAIIFASAFAIVYALDPLIFRELFRMGVEEGIDRI